MRRAQFLKNLALLGMTPAIISAVAEKRVEAIVVKEPIGKKIAIDLEAITNVGVIRGGKTFTPKEILEMYHKTGVLLYRSRDREGQPFKFSPITVIDE